MFPQVVKHLDQLVIASALINHIMVLLICFRNGHGFPFGNGIPEIPLHALQLIHVLLRHPLTCKFNGKFFQ